MGIILCASRIQIHAFGRIFADFIKYNNVLKYLIVLLLRLPNSNNSQTVRRRRDLLRDATRVLVRFRVRAQDVGEYRANMV